MKEARWKADVAIAAVSLVWGATFVMVKEALEDISTLLFLATRFSLGTAALWLVFRTRGGGVPNPRAEWLGGLYSGLALLAGYVLQTAGLRLTTPSKSAFLTGLYIVLVPILGAFVYKREPKRLEVVGVILAGAGMALMTLPRGFTGVEFGDVLTIGCAVAFAVQILVLSRYSAGARYERLALIQIGTVAAGSLLTFWWAETPFVTWSSRVIWAIAVTGILATALAFAVQTWAQARTTATRAAIIFSLEPVFAGVVSALVGGEEFTRGTLAGAGLILGGILLAELKPTTGEGHPSS
ncbi:MAG: DMT family transporter [Bryobacteraceae bacterium]|nr:DMT family transporter [Bryobacteraceae bacterium]